MICVEEVKETLDYQNSSGNASGSKSESKRMPHDAIYVISGRTNVVERYDPVKCACVPCPEMSLKRTDGVSLTDKRRAVNVGQDLYCVSTPRVEKFDLLKLCWTQVAAG